MKKLGRHIGIRVVGLYELGKVTFFAVLEHHVVDHFVVKLVEELEDVPVFEGLVDVDLVFYFGLKRFAVFCLV